MSDNTYRKAWTDYYKDFVKQLEAEAEAYDKRVNGNAAWTPPPDGQSWDDYYDSCYHNWKEYVGLNEVYEYCTRCDAKREKIEIIEST